MRTVRARDRSWIGGWAVAVATLGLTGCLPVHDGAARDPEPVTSSRGDAFPVSVVVAGGMCSDRTACSTTLTVQGDGSWQSAAQGDQTHGGTLPEQDLQHLRQVLADADLESYAADPALDPCPDALDGPRTTYRFEGAALALSPCTHDVSPTDEPFRTLDRLRARLT